MGGSERGDREHGHHHYHYRPCPVCDPEGAERFRVRQKRMFRNLSTER